MVVFSKKYITKLSVDIIQAKLKKITSREYALEDDPVFFIGSINYDNFQIEPDYMDRFRSSVPKLYGTYLTNDKETVVSVKIEYRYGILKLVLVLILALVLYYDKWNYTNDLPFIHFKELGIFVCAMIILDSILFTISSYKLLSTLKIFIAAKKS